MRVDRLSKRALQQILSGKIKEDDATIVVKFYSNNCHYCKALQEPYKEVADEYPDLHFFAFNLGDYAEVEKILNFRGIPTICIMKFGQKRVPKIRVMPDPPKGKAHKKTWYRTSEIKSFIEKEK
tara:strand:- start:3616 stop:3987 length:372 start_codon:yes stop_codon:yes gene_type:complete